jgi:hypothetical protein
MASVNGYADACERCFDVDLYKRIRYPHLTGTNETNFLTLKEHSVLVNSGGHLSGGRNMVSDR